MDNELLTKIFEKLVSIEQNMATKNDIQVLQGKIDHITEQVAMNSEDMSNLRHDIEFTYREQSAFKLELDRIKRQVMTKEPQ